MSTANPGTPEADYAVFLSYNSADRELVTSIHARLAEMGIPAFQDETALNTGQQFMPELSAAIKASRSVAVFITAHVLGPYQELEMQLAIDYQIQQRSRGVAIPVFAVLLPGGKAGMIPDMLRLNTFLDLRNVPDGEERVQRLTKVLNGQRPSERVRRTQPRAVLIGAGAAALLVAGSWYFFNRKARLTPLRGPTSFDWKDPRLWDGAHWSNPDGRTLLVAGPIPGFLRLGSGITLLNFEVDVNLAIQADQLPISWVIRSEDGGTRLVFRYSPPSDRVPGVFSGSLVGGAKDAEFCRSDIYTEKFGAGHALLVKSSFTSNGTTHRFHLTCPYNDPRCDSDHDPLENLPQSIGCVLPANAPRERQFGFAAPPGGSFILQEFTLSGIDGTKP